MLPLLSETPERARQIEAFGRLDQIMGIGSAAPSAKAAAIVLEVARGSAGGLPQGSALQSRQDTAGTGKGEAKRDKGDTPGDMARQC
jgi:hypothetical protein